MISDLTTEIFGKSGGSHTNVFEVEIGLLLLDSMVFMLPVMEYLSLDFIQFSKKFRGIRSAEIKFPNSHACHAIDLAVSSDDEENLDGGSISSDEWTDNIGE